jgi:hypothetical protein
MRTGDLTSGSARLHESWKKLRAHWEATQLSWQDTVAREFDENYIASLEPQIVSTLERMKTLTGVLTSAQHECER